MKIPYKHVQPMSAEQLVKFREAKAKQKRRETERARVPAAHTDKLYTGWDTGLQARIHGRAHRREVMQRRGEQAGHRIYEV